LRIEGPRYQVQLLSLRVLLKHDGYLDDLTEFMGLFFHFHHNFPFSIQHEAFPR